MFRFKQFSVDQTGCAMKINTDGVLLGAIAGAEQSATILDIGTGTGVIALMLAQKYPKAKVDAVEIDPDAALTAERNFKNSPFAKRLQVFALGFEEFFEEYPDRKYDLIVSNPPFYVDSLKSPGAKKSLAKHAGADFFERLVREIAAHLSPGGYCWMVLPESLDQDIVFIAEDNCLYQPERILVRSYPDSAPHRLIIGLSAMYSDFAEYELTIYESRDIYSKGYKKLLKPYFLAF